MGGFMIQMGLYSSWGCIVSISVFDWGCISFSKGWGSIQEWGWIEADTVFSIENHKLGRKSHNSPPLEDTLHPSYENPNEAPEC